MSLTGVKKNNNLKWKKEEKSNFYSSDVISLFDEIAPSGMNKVLLNWMDSYATFGLVPCYTAMFITLFDPGSHKNYEKDAKSIWQKNRFLLQPDWKKERRRRKNNNL